MEKIKIQINFHSHWDIMNPKDYLFKSSKISLIDDKNIIQVSFLLKKNYMHVPQFLFIYINAVINIMVKYH